MTTEQKFDCIFCKEVFEDKETLQIHFRKHGDPNFNQIKTKMRSPNEALSQETPQEENEMVGCDVCDEVFPTISKAITHKHKAHPDHDAKHFCPFCGKLFTMKHLYNKHVQSNHKGHLPLRTREFYCDACKVNFYLASAMLHHNKHFHRQDTELPDVGQSKKIKTFYNETLQIYYCCFCGEEYNNKVNLHKHMADDHGDENQSPSEVLRCPLCDAMFYHLDAYEVHLTFHTTDDIYSETNETMDEVTEFSLETVAPIMERVEEEIPESAEDGATDAHCIENYLQLIMNESTEADVPEKIKQKKHKKHKKSKKETITLDEFLNMNKDVFGDGLDVHGIEEVPTQVVLKKVACKKLPVKNDAKVVNDLAKLKKQGITVKTKSGKKALAGHFNKNSKKLLVDSTKVTNNPTEILSKLMNQGNSQIKIIKKSVPQNSSTETNTAELNTDTDELNDKKEIASDILDIQTTSSISTEISEIPDTSHMKSKINDSDCIGETNSDKFNTDDNKISTDTDIVNKQSPQHQDWKTASIDVVKTSNIYSQSQNTNNSKTLIRDKILDEPKNDLLADYNINNSSSNAKYKENEDDRNVDSHEEDSDSKAANKTLNALKHLSHLITVKSVNQPKSVDSTNVSIARINKESNSTETVKNVSKGDLKYSFTEQKLNLKSLGNDFNKSPALYEDTHSDNENNFNTEYEKLNEIESGKQVKLKIRNIPRTQGKILTKNTTIEAEHDAHDDKDEFNAEDNSEKPCNNDILKRLSNVTAKSISSGNNKQLPIKINKAIVNQATTSKNISKHPIINQEVEVFNIEDSDSDGTEQVAHNNKVASKQPAVAPDTLRNVNKIITIKSSHQNVNIVEEGKRVVSKTFQSNKSTEKQTFQSNKSTEKQTFQSNKSTEKHYTLSKHSSDIQKSLNLQNKLKNLGGNITVKSSNHSPNVENKEFYGNSDTEDNDKEFDSESEMNVGKVKITELNEGDTSDNDYDCQTNAIVQSPDASHSDNDFDHDVSEDEFGDFEEKISPITVKKRDEPSTSEKLSTHLENFKNFNKNLTIKQLSSKKNDSDESVSDPPEASEDQHIGKRPSVLQFKSNQQQQAPQNVKPANRAIVIQPSGSSSQTVNKNVSTSQANQVNTVKTVKKFQSQTVIEEITTTVTKTIRTVNQSSNEVLQNNARCGTYQPRPMIRPQQQRVCIRPTKESQNTAIRHGSPAVGTRIRNASPASRQPAPAPSTAIALPPPRPVGHIVAVRPALVHAQRHPAPGTSALRKAAPPRQSPQKPPIGKLKISPQALHHSMKRPSDELSQFTCFKKPKECVVPASTESDDEATMQFTSCNSQSSFSSMTKTMKGSVGTVTQQTRSEVTSSQQHLSRLNNLSGLKIVKTSSKQAMQVEEKCEMNPSQNTLQALEKLQKHGLLIKKPRIDDYEEHNSPSDSDDDAS